MDVEELQKIMIIKGLKLSVAESCTGGSLSATLTQIPGCSKYFLGGIVAYSNDLKKKLLGISPAVLEKEGAVSEAVVVQMAEGMLRLSGSDYSIAVSGIAGPEGGTNEKPVGTIWGAIAQKNGNTETYKFLLSGKRQGIFQQTCENLLAKLLEKLYEEELPMGK